MQQQAVSLLLSCFQIIHLFCVVWEKSLRGGFVDPLKVKLKGYLTLKHLIMGHQGFVDAAAVHCKKFCLKS